MRKIHTILRLHHQAGLSRREIARSQKIGYGTVGNYLTRARSAGLSWPLPPDMDERALELALFPDQRTDTPQRREDTRSIWIFKDHGPIEPAEFTVMAAERRYLNVGGIGRSIGSRVQRITEVTTASR